MDARELTARLRRLGMTKPEFAAATGLSSYTVYQWKVAPQWVDFVLKKMERIEDMESFQRGKRAMEAVVVPKEDGRRNNPGRPENFKVRK